MTDIGFGMVDKRSVAAILFALTVASIIGLKIPIDTSSVGGLFIDIVLLTGALYVARSLLRLPVIVVIATKIHWPVQDLSWYIYESSFNSFDKGTKIVGFSLVRVFDRLVLIGLVFLACVPSFRPYVSLVGVIGLVFMLLVYTLTNSFSFLVRDAIDLAKSEESEERSREKMLDTALTAPRD